MGKLKELFVSKQAELDKIKADIEKQKQKQQLIIDKIQKEYKELVAKKKRVDIDIKKYYLTKSVVFRFAEYLKALNTKRVVWENRGMDKKLLPPETPEILANRYHVEKLVAYLNDVGYEEIVPQVTQKDVSDLLSKLNKEKGKLSKI